VVCLHVSMSPRLNPHGTSRIRLCGFEPILDQHSAASKVSHSTTVTTSLYTEPPHVASTAHHPHTCVGWSERRTTGDVSTSWSSPLFVLRVEQRSTIAHRSVASLFAPIMLDWCGPCCPLKHHDRSLHEYAVRVTPLNEIVTLSSPPERSGYQP
jgi:hypothetical protein